MIIIPDEDVVEYCSKACVGYRDNYDPYYNEIPNTCMLVRIKNPDTGVYEELNISKYESCKMKYEKCPLIHPTSAQEKTIIDFLKK